MVSAYIGIGMKIKTLVLGMVSTNCYLIINETTNETIIVDPAARAEKIISLLEQEHCIPKGIFLTHGHFDHIMAVNELVMEYHIPVYAHAEEKKLLMDARINCSEQTGCPYIVNLKEELQDGVLLDIAGYECKVIYTPGHTKGGVCYYFEKEKVLFSGDTVFSGSVGRTDLPTGNDRELLESIRNKIAILPEDIKVYPGHGESTMIGYEKKYNYYF